MALAIGSANLGQGRGGKSSPWRRVSLEACALFNLPAHHVDEAVSTVGHASRDCNGARMNVCKLLLSAERQVVWDAALAARRVASHAARGVAPPPLPVPRAEPHVERLRVTGGCYYCGTCRVFVNRDGNGGANHCDRLIEFAQGLPRNPAFKRNSAPAPAADDFIVVGRRNGWFLPLQERVGAMTLWQREVMLQREAAIKKLIRGGVGWNVLRNYGFVGR